MWSCLHHVRQSLANALAEADALCLPLSNPTSHPQSSSHDSYNNTRLLEIQRLSVVFFRSLLFEGSSLSTKSLGVDDSLRLNSSSEIPVIPHSLVRTVAAGSLQSISETVGAVVSEIAKCVDVQRSLLELCSRLRHNHAPVGMAESLVSPIVVRGAFEFFADFVR